METREVTRTLSEEVYEQTKPKLIEEIEQEPEEEKDDDMWLRTHAGV